MKGICEGLTKYIGKTGWAAVGQNAPDAIKQLLGPLVWRNIFCGWHKALKHRMRLPKVHTI